MKRKSANKPATPVPEYDIVRVATVVQVTVGVVNKATKTVELEHPLQYKITTFDAKTIEEIERKIADESQAVLAQAIEALANRE